MSSKESSKEDKKKTKKSDHATKVGTKTSVQKRKKTNVEKIGRSLEPRKQDRETGDSTANKDLTDENKPLRYWEAVGRRKRSIARVRLFTRGEKEVVANDKAVTDYFPTAELQDITLSALQKMKSIERFRVIARVRGGGIHSQAEAVRHATARALVKFNPDFRRRLRKAGYLTRDPREKERRKYGLKKARRAPQWQKR